METIKKPVIWKKPWKGQGNDDPDHCYKLILQIKQNDLDIVSRVAKQGPKQIPNPQSEFSVVQFCRTKLHNQLRKSTLT